MSGGSGRGAGDPSPDEEAQRERALSILNRVEATERLVDKYKNVKVSEILNANVSALTGDVKRTRSAEKLQTYADEKRDAEIDRITGDNRRRSWFFYFVLAITGIPVVVSSGVMVRIAWDGEVTDPVLIAFFASVVVEVIGLAIIVANYLFPKNGSLHGMADHEPKESTNQSDGKDD